MSEDGEISLSPNSAALMDGLDDFIIDKNCSGIIPNEDLERETPSADDDAEVKTSSNWAKNMRKRMFGEQVLIENCGEN